MGDLCLSGVALGVVSSMVGGLVLAIITLYRALLASKDREIDRLERLAAYGNDMTERSLGLAKRARAGTA